MFKQIPLLFLLVSFYISFDFDNFRKSNKSHFDLDLDDKIDLDMKFDNFRKKFHKHYNKKDIPERKKNFKKNLIKTNLQNKETFKFKMDINKFSDLSWKQFSDFYLMKFNIISDLENLKKKHPEKIKFVKDMPNVKIPTITKPQNHHKNRHHHKNPKKHNFRFLQDYYFSYYNPYYSNYYDQYSSQKVRIDPILDSYKKHITWKTHSSPIKNQKRCAACYAFAALSALELINSQNSFNTNPLSEQEIIDCDRVNKGCIGGSPHRVFDYINQNGISYTKNYPYVAYEQDTCLRKNSDGKYRKYLDYYFIRDPVELVIALNKGPSILLFHANDSFKKYSSGIFNDKNCSGNLNHAVVAVGYDLRGEVPYVICKNGWGENWGEEGYFRIALGDVVRGGRGICEMFSHYASVVPLIR